MAVEITEVEAYGGTADPGCHTFNGPTARNRTMFSSGGHLYCYFTYGMHHAINVVSDRAGCGTGVLLRAGRVLAGAELAHSRRMARRRTPVPEHRLASGPGNLAQALGADLSDDGADLVTSPVWQLRLGERTGVHREYAHGPRVGVGGPGGDPAVFPWRLWMPGQRSVSAFRPGRDVVCASRWAVGPRTSVD